MKGDRTTQLVASEKIGFVLELVHFVPFTTIVIRILEVVRMISLFTKERVKNMK